MKSRRFAAALPLLQKAIDEDPSNWGAWYMAGQCYRFMDELPTAVSYHSKAAALKPDEPAVLLALGIALQLTNRLGEAVEVFRQAIEVDQDYELAYNSLAMTQKKQGEFELALHNYDAGANALSRRIVRGLRNDRSSTIFKHEDMEHHLWAEYAIYGALYLASLTDSIEGMALPTSEQAMKEERDEYHSGLYWVDTPNSEGKQTRLYLPNFLNTFRETLKHDRAYCDLIGNRATILKELGRSEEAKKHLAEAAYFLPES